MPKLCKLTNDIKYFGWQVEVVTAGGKKHYHLRYDWYDDINNPPIKFNEIIIKPRVVMADGHVDGNFFAFREVAVAILENNKYSDYYDKIYSLNYRSREDIYQETTERNRLCFECVRVLYGKFLLEREPVAQDGHRGIKADEFEAFKELMGTAVYYLRKFLCVLFATWITGRIMRCLSIAYLPFSTGTGMRRQIFIFNGFPSIYRVGFKRLSKIKICPYGMKNPRWS